jgi:hypothetical protein
MKSFLLVLPEEQLASFNFSVHGPALARRASSSSSLAAIRARRMAAVAGQ